MDELRKSKIESLLCTEMHTMLTASRTLCEELQLKVQSYQRESTELRTTCEAQTIEIASIGQLVPAIELSRNEIQHNLQSQQVLYNISIFFDNLLN